MGLDVATDDRLAVGEVALVVIGYAIGPVIIARRLNGVPTVVVVAASLALTALADAPVGIAQRPAVIPSTQVLLSVGILGALCTALAFLLLFALIGAVGPIRATVITYFDPASRSCSACCSWRSRSRSASCSSPSDRSSRQAAPDAPRE